MGTRIYKIVNINMLKFLGIIPARYASTRFPAKPLAMLGGKTVIQRVYEQVVGILVLYCTIFNRKSKAFFHNLTEKGGLSYII